MSEEEILRRAHVVDFDDTIMGREKITRFFGLVMGKLRPQHLPDLTLEDIAQLDLNHGRVEVPIGGVAERFSFWVHSKRRLYPEVQSNFEELIADGVDIYGATGRLNESAWVDLSEKQLGSARDLMKGISFTPRGVKTAVSKAHTVWLLLESDQYGEQYDEVEIDEDDPRTIEFLLRIFAEDSRVKFNYIPYATTSRLVSTERMEHLPNVWFLPRLYEDKSKTEKPPEEALKEAHQRIQKLQTRGHLRFAQLQLRTSPKDPNSLPGKLHGLIFNRLLGRFGIDNNVVDISGDLARVLPFGSPVRDIFRDAFFLGATSATIFQLVERYQARIEGLGQASMIIVKGEAGMSEFNRSITDRLSKVVGISPELMLENLEVSSQLGLRMGRLLADPNLQISEAVGLFNQYREQTSNFSGDIRTGHRNAIRQRWDS